MNLLEVKNICKIYGSGETAVKALRDVSFSVPKGEYVAIVGESGSGKSTLLNMIGALDLPTSGKVLIDGKDIFSMNDRKLTVFRRRNIGFIFQAFNLIPELTVEQNMIFPLLLDYQKPDKRDLEELLTVLNLKDRRNHLPSQLSGGQQQRVAIGRALITRPSLILADEPTSSRAGIDHINIVSYDDTLLDYSKGSIAQGALDAVYGDSNKVATVFNRNNSLRIGDTIQFAGEEVEITCALSQGLFGDDLIIICSQETFDRIMGDTKYGLIGIQLDSNATEETIAEIRSLENDDIIITDQREGNRQNNATYWAARIVCYGFLAIIGVISLFNIVNSISMSVSARIKQYGAMRAVGMDNRQLKRMISAEAYTYAISGLMVGCGIGLPLSRFLYNRLITHYFGIEWRFPILWFGIVVAFIFISAIVSVYAPAKRIRNMPITATINEL